MARPKITDLPIVDSRHVLADREEWMALGELAQPGDVVRRHVQVSGGRRPWWTNIYVRPEILMASSIVDWEIVVTESMCRGGGWHPGHVTILSAEDGLIFVPPPDGMEIPPSDPNAFHRYSIIRVTACDAP